jgi:glutaredoxin
MVATLYSKPGCHLCEDVREFLEALSPEHGFTLEEVNIEADATLFERYRYAIPVVLINGAEVARGRVSEHQLRSVLEGNKVQRTKYKERSP